MASEANATEGAKKLASEKQVDLSRVTGSGEGGRISRDDVQNFLDTSGSTALDGTATKEEQAQEVIRVRLNPKRSAIGVVAYVGGERREFVGGETVSPKEWDQLRKLKGDSREGGKVQLLLKGGGS